MAKRRKFTAKFKAEVVLEALREEFNGRHILLSQSLLISEETADTHWLLADFEKQKTYNIRKENDTTVEVSDGVDLEKHTDTLNDAGTIVPRLQEGLSTHIGLIDALQRLNFNTANLENLKRSDLAVRKLDFESVYPDLEVTYKMLYEILAAPRTALISLSSKDVQQLKNHILQSYEMSRKIVDFGAGERDENIRDQHNSLLREIRQFCERVKSTLLQAAAYLSSKTVEQLEDRRNAVLANVEERLNTTISTETEKLQKLGEEAQQSEEKRQEDFDQLYIQLQNQLTEKPISQYKTIFNEQAKKHRRNAWIWLGVTGLLTIVFGGIFWWLLKDLVPAANQLSTALSNLFTKGFFISLIFFLLNRSIKNYTAEKHLEVINTHRQNALETVDPFLDATKENRDTRDQILLAATKTIYDANQSGYLSTKISGSDTANPVQQIIKEVIPTKSSDN